MLRTHRPPDRPTATPPSLAPAAEIEAHEQHVGIPSVRERPERLDAPHLLDRPLRFEVERIIPRAPEDLQIAHRPVAMHQERDLRLERNALDRALPDPQHLRDDILQVLGERELHAFRAHRRDVGAGRRLLPGERRRLGRGARRRLALPTRRSHRATASGSATRPTSVTPAARITASTWTTSAYGTRPSARRYTPVGRLVRTKAGNVARKSPYESAAWSMKMRPSRSRVTTRPDFGSRGRASARGNRTSTPPCMIGAVIMKMISSTNATSTSDVTLMSAFRGSSPCARNPPPPPPRSPAIRASLRAPSCR